jgi:flagellar export protein FliJ
MRERQLALHRRGKKAATSLGKDINALRNAEGCVDTVPPHRARRLASGGRPRLFDAAAPGLRGEHKSMKSRETFIRLRKFQVDERRRRVAQIESMISEFERISSDLERDIKIEQDRSGIHDPGHFAYPTYAKAAIQRRDNLKRSTNDLKMQLEDAKAALTEAFEEMKKAELLDERDQMRERAEEDVGAQVEPEAVDMMRTSAQA